MQFTSFYGPASKVALPSAENISRPQQNSTLRRLVLLCESPAWSALLALTVYMLFAAGHGSLWHKSQHAYFNYLADAFLHGQLNLRFIPLDTLDLSLFHGEYYLYWPPVPALMLTPFVALFGMGFSDILFTVVLAAVNVSLVAALLRQGCRRRIVRVSKLQRGTLVLFFAFGTVHLTLAPFGRVWFTGQIVGFFCVAAAYLAALSLRGRLAFALTGLAIASALLTRNHLVFTGLWPACYLLFQHRRVGCRRMTSYVLTGLLPVALAVGLYGAYNYLRFGSVFDNGLAHHLVNPVFAADYCRYGAFNLYYVPTNFFYQYVAYPLPLRPASYYGGSLFLLSPVFFAAFGGIINNRLRWSMWALLATILLVAIPILLLMGTGHFQFGPRYTLDFTVPLLLLTAAGVRRWSARVLAYSTYISTIHYFIGALNLMLFL